ncbi:hypothetical protein ACNKHT_06185 [Shigella flexneri]
MGTSNYDLARRLSLTPMGTQAHEWSRHISKSAGISPTASELHFAAWLKNIPDQLGIALTDCITMDAFLVISVSSSPVAIRACVMTLATRLNGVKKPLHIMKSSGINPQSKTLVFSDNLDLRKAVELCRFSSRVQ